HGPKRDRVLWEYRAAAAAMRRGQFAEAKPLLDDALVTLGGIYGPDKEARRARGYFSPETKRTFIGEPYERVMAYYYRGILYWFDGELDNARACFRSAQIMDSDAENKSYASDYVLLDYLDGLATARLGGGVMDHVLANKAVFKTASDTAGTAAIISGAILAGQQDRHSVADEVGVGLLAAGVITKIFSAATTPAADTRAWDNLPQYLSFASTQLRAGAHTVTVEFLDAGGRPMANLTRTVTINVSDPARDTVVFVSDKNQ